LFAPSSLRAGDLQIQIPQVQPTTASSVNFPTPVPDWGPVTQDEFVRLPAQTYQSDQRRFNVSINIESSPHDSQNRFVFDLYVQKAGESGAERFHVTEFPVGVFTDYLASLPINIQSASNPDTVTLNAVPIHALYEGPVFALGGDGTPYEVKLGSSSQISVPLTSNLSDLQVEINQVTAASTSCKECWLQPIPNPDHDPIVQPKGSTNLILTLQPNTLHALFASAFAVNPRKSHDVLAVYVTSTPGQGGIQGLPQRLEVPIRFTPSFLFLASAIILGSLIGFAIRRLIPGTDSKAAGGDAAPPAEAGQGRFPRWVRDLLLSVATAVVVEIVGLILFSNTNTSVVVFGFSLDPSQVAPAFLIAILVAGGPPVVTKISGAIKL
jgi:hypothetical protein